MKRTIQITAVALAALVILSGCGNVANPNNAGTTTATTNPATSQTTTGTAQGTPTDLTVTYLVTGAVPTDLTLVQNAINQVVTPKINATVTLMPVNFGAAMQQYNLMLSSGEKLDLLMTFPTTYQSLVAQGKIQEIGPLLDQYGQGIKDALGNFLKGSVINGKIYGVRPGCEMGGGGGLVIRKDIVDKVGIDLSTLKSFSDIGSVLKAIKDKEPNATPLTYSNQDIGIVGMEMLYRIDNLTDNFGVLMDNGNSLKVVDLFETPEYAADVKLVRDWYQKGYIMKDVSTSKEDQHSLIKSGKAYCYTTPTKPGIAQQESATNGYECLVQEYSKPVATSGTIFQWVVPVACKAPDKAIQMLNLMYTDADVENLLSWGIEGKHYEKKADGTIGFPAGVTDTTSGYYINQPWMMGNELLTYVWNGNPPDLWEQIRAFNKNTTIPKSLGFSYDATPVKTEVAAVTNVYNQYKLGIENGTMDPARKLPEFISKLKTAGIDKIVTEKQKQLDAWAAANGVK